MKKILLNLLISCSLISHVLYISSAGQKKPTYAEMMAAKKNLTATPTSSSSDVGSTRKKKTRTPPPPAARLQTLNINDLIEQKWKYFDPSATSWLDLITNFENQNKREDIIRFAGEDKHSLEYMYRNNSITPFIYNNKKTKYESSDPSINEEYREFIGIGKDGTGQNMLGIAMTIVNWEIHNRRLATKLTNTWKSFNPSAKSWFDANIQSNATTLDATKERDLVLFFDQLANSQSTFGSKTLIYDNTKATYPNPSGNQARATQIENLRNSLGCGTKGKGDNVLGLALMEAREILQKQDIQKPSSQKEALLKKQQQRKQQKKLTKEEKTKLLNEPIKLQTKKSWSEGVNEFLGYVRTAIEYVVDTAISILSWGYNIFHAPKKPSPTQPVEPPAKPKTKTKKLSSTEPVKTPTEAKPKPKTKKPSSTKTVETPAKPKSKPQTEKTKNETSKKETTLTKKIEKSPENIATREQSTRIIVTVGDLLAQKVSIIVDPANTIYIPTKDLGGVSRAISDTEDGTYEHMRKKLYEGKTFKAGDVAVLDSVEQPNGRRYIILAFGPDCRNTEKEAIAKKLNTLKNTYIKALQEADKLNKSSKIKNLDKKIAFPVISTGIFACPPEGAIKAAVDGVKEYLWQDTLKETKTSLEEIRFVIYPDKNSAELMDMFRGALGLESAYY